MATLLISVARGLSLEGIVQLEVCVDYARAGHNSSDLVHRRDRERRWAAWFQEHLDANTR